jgi:hypothetical protein
MSTGTLQPRVVPAKYVLANVAVLQLHVAFCAAAVPTCDPRLGITDRQYRGVYTKEACTAGPNELYAYAHFTVARDGHVSGMRTEFVEPFLSNLPRTRALQSCVEKMVNFVAVDIRLAPPMEVCEISLPIYSTVLLYNYGRANVAMPQISPGSSK